MSGGSAKAKPFFNAAIVVQPVEALDAFVRIAARGAEFVYCEAPEPMRSTLTWARAGELAQRGLVRLMSRRRAGGGWQYYVERTGQALPRQKSAAEKVLAERASAIIFAQLKREARMGLPCSSNAALARIAGLALPQQAGQRVMKLADAALIQSQQVYDGGVPARVVTILKSKHAGDAAGAMTAPPRKWLALREAAEKELREEDERELARLRRSGAL